MLCLWLIDALFHTASRTRLPNLEQAIWTYWPWEDNGEFKDSTCSKKFELEMKWLSVDAPILIPPVFWGSCLFPCRWMWWWEPGGRGCPIGQTPELEGQQVSACVDCWEGASVPWTWPALGPAENRGNTWRTEGPGYCEDNQTVILWLPSVVDCYRYVEMRRLHSNSSHKLWFIVSTSVAMLPSAVSEW